MKSLLHNNRRIIAELSQAGLVTLALCAAFLLRFEFAVPHDYLGMLGQSLLVVLALKLTVFRLFGLRHLGWRYFGFEDLIRLGLGHFTGGLVSAVGLRVAVGDAFPRSIYLLDFGICLLAEIGMRAAIRLLLDPRSYIDSSRQTIVTLIYGAGKAGLTVLAEIKAHPELGLKVVGFLDDDPAKRSMRMQGLRVLGERADLVTVARAFGVEQILIVLPNVTGSDLTDILEQCHAAQVTAKRVPALAELIEHKVLVDQIREVRLEDLLGRAPARWSNSHVADQLAGQVVLVTGAGGSIGSELCRQIAALHATGEGPAALVGFDIAETALYEIEQEMAASFPGVNFRTEVGSVQSRRRLEELFARWRPHVIYHAAAYKHVPLMEAHLFEAIENNVFGTRNLVRAAFEWDAASFVLISSDKAVAPANVMGVTKRVAEMVTLAGSATARELGTAGAYIAGSTRLSAVRFGNVLGSNGSVIPRFRRQIAAGGPLTLTHPDMKRFFMTIPEAAQLVLEAGAMASQGEVFVLDMGEPVRIADLARKMILLSGLRPEIDVPIVFTGPRPGEKLYEELSAYTENTAPTLHSQIRVLTGPRVSPSLLADALDALRQSVRSRDAAGAVMVLKDLVPDYNPSAHILRRVLRPHAGREVRSVVA